MNFLPKALLATALLVGGPVFVYEAQASSAAVRALATEKADAFVTLEVVIDIRFGGFGGGDNTSQRRTEITVPIVDPSGLSVSALSTVDPGTLSARISGDEDRFVTRLRSAQYIFPDGREIPVGVTLRDPEFDLVFFKPLEPIEEPMAFIDITNSAIPELLDPVYTVTRLGRISRRAILAMSGEIQAVVRGPRSYFIPSSELISNNPGNGNPIFDADGRFVGLVGLITFPGGMRAIGEDDQPFSYVIVPADDVLAIFDQAKEAEVEAPEDLPDIEEEESDEE